MFLVIIRRVILGDMCEELLIYFKISIVYIFWVEMIEVLYLGVFLIDILFVCRGEGS